MCRHAHACCRWWYLHQRNGNACQHHKAEPLHLIIHKRSHLTPLCVCARARVYLRALLKWIEKRQQLTSVRWIWKKWEQQWFTLEKLSFINLLYQTISLYERRPFSSVSVIGVESSLTHFHFPNTTKKWIRSLSLYLSPAHQLYQYISYNWVICSVFSFNYIPLEMTYVFVAWFLCFRNSIIVENL